MNRAYINLYAPPIKIFKLDKVATTVDELYGEVQGSRIYLPPFEIKAFHFDNPWKEELGVGTMPYLEPQENIVFHLNFDEMVQKIRDLRNQKTAEIKIEYSGTGVPSASKIKNTFLLKVGGSTILNCDLTSSNYNTIQKLATYINNQTGFSIELMGENAVSTDLVSFIETTFPNSILDIFVIDPTYQNITDVVEAGDVILTHKWHLYEVLKNTPAGDFGWNYVTYRLEANIRSLDEAALGPWDAMIRNREYGLRDRINLE